MSGFNVSPKRLHQAARCCNAIRTLSTTNGSTSHVSVCQLVRQCQKTEAIDGFLYNTCVLSIERSLAHKRMFIRGLTNEMNIPRRRRSISSSVISFIEERLACHIDVLIHTSHIDPMHQM